MRSAVIKGLARFIVESLAALLHGWVLMLAIGMLHREWWPAIPTIGYWWSVLTVVLLRGVFSHLPKPDAS